MLETDWFWSNEKLFEISREEDSSESTPVTRESEESWEGLKDVSVFNDFPKKSLAAFECVCPQVKDFAHWSSTGNYLLWSTDLGAGVDKIR